MYRCFSGFAACVGDAAGTWGSIVLSVCVCKCVFCCDFYCLSSFGVIFLYLSFSLPVRDCVTCCEFVVKSVMFSVCILCRVECLQGLLAVLVTVSVCL